MISIFQRFVAWRYLLQRPRKLSVPVMVVLVIALLGAGATYLYATKGMEAWDPRRQDVLLAAVGNVALAFLAALLLLVRYFFTFFTTVSVAGVSIGSMALVIVLSVMSGFETDLRTKILGSNAHILVTKHEGPFTDYRAVREKVDQVKGIAASMPYAVSEVVIAANRNYANVIIKGVVPEQVSAVTSLGKNLRELGGVERLWPLAEDGSIIGRPPEDTAAPIPDTDPAPPSDDVMDPVPDDFGSGDGAPVDYSGGVVDPAPFDVRFPGGEPEDFSGTDVPDAPGADRETENGGADAPVAAKGRESGVGQPPASPAAAAGDAPGDILGKAPSIDDLRAPAFDDAGVRSRVRTQQLIRDDDGGITGGVVSITALGDDPFAGDDFDDTAFADLPPPPIPPRVATLPGVLVGRELVKTIHLYVGQEVRMISPLTDPINPGGAPLPYTRNYRVAGTFYTGMYEYDLKFVYVELESLQRFLNLGDEVDGIEIRIADPDETESVAANLRRMLGPEYRVQDWKELNRNLFAALKLEKIAMFLVLAIIILVASFSIIGNLIMTVVEKAKEIALLKTLGASDGEVMQIFITQGFFIGLVGTGLGVGQGLLACFLGARFGLPLNPDVYYIDRLPIAVEMPSVLAVAIAGVAISVVATIYPAYVAARLRPAEGLRYE